MMIMTSCVKCDPCISEGISSPETLCIVQIMLSLNCFLSFCSNMYCSHLWSSFKKSSFNKVRVAYNNCFRMLFKLPRSCSASHMFVYNSVLSFGELLRKSVYNSSHNYLVTKALERYFIHQLASCVIIFICIFVIVFIYVCLLYYVLSCTMGLEPDIKNK